MKIAILADTHFGVRQDSEAFHNNMEEFFKNEFFPYLAKEGIDQIIHVGDVFDSRRDINMYTASRAREYFFDPLLKNGIKMVVTAGNHDLYYRHDSSVTALKEILGLYPNITFLTEVTDYGIGGDTYCMVPWIHNNNRDQSLERIAKSPARVVFGHLELTGYQMYKGQISKHGEDASLFEKFEHCYSGHFHHKNSIGNITYLGSVSQHIWLDHGDVRGFHIFDSVTHEMKFVRNQNDMFYIVNYGDDLDISTFKGKYVKMRYGEVKSQKKFDDYVKSIQATGVKSFLTVPDEKYQLEYNENTDGTSEDLLDTVGLFKLIKDEDEYNKLLDLHALAQLIL